MGQADHKYYKAYKAEHKWKKATDGGSCLSDHKSVYREQNSCSYRWQGLEKAGESLGLGVYNHDNVNIAWHVGQNGFRYKGSRAIAKGFAGKIVRLTGKVSKDGKKHAEILNFTNGSVPYHNQVHHVLPTGVLRESIEDLVKIAPTIKDLICKGLLKEKYNQNFKDNMLILPVRDVVACVVGLPTHLGSHNRYSAKVKKAVSKALDPYKKIANQVRNGKKKHDQDDPKSLKHDLLRISKTLYREIMLRSGKSKSGFIQGFSAAVDDLPAKIFKRI